MFLAALSFHRKHTVLSEEQWQHRKSLCVGQVSLTTGVLSWCDVWFPPLTSAPSHSWATDTCRPPSLSSAGGNTPSGLAVVCAGLWFPVIILTSAHLAFPRCWLIKQHLVHLHVQAFVGRRGRADVRLRHRWRWDGASVGVADAPVAAAAAVRELAASTVHRRSWNTQMQRLLLELTADDTQSDP